MKVGNKFYTEHRLVRTEKDKKDKCGWSRLWKYWKEEKLITGKTEVIYLGKRTLSNGYVEYYSEGISYLPKEYIKALLVCSTDGKTNPFYILKGGELMELQEQAKKIVDRFEAYGISPKQKMSMYEAISKCLDITDELKAENERLKKERFAMDCLIRDIEDVACGEKQVANDDSEGMGWIYARIQQALKGGE